MAIFFLSIDIEANDEEESDENDGFKDLEVVVNVGIEPDLSQDLANIISKVRNIVKYFRQRTQRKRCWKPLRGLKSKVGPDQGEKCFTIPEM